MKGCNSILIDSGSAVNVIGAKTAEQFMLCANYYGVRCTVTLMDRTIAIAGVGEGVVKCTHQLICDVAVQVQEQNPLLMKYMALIATGSGEHLPAIIGRSSLQSNNAVLMMDRSGNQLLALPGPGGYEVTWAPGARIFPLKASLSGHMTLQCDHYEGNPNAGGHTTLMAEKLKNHKILTVSEHKARFHPPGTTSKSSSKATVLPTTATPKPAAPPPPMAIPMEPDTVAPLKWNQFVKKYKGYPKEEQQRAYWAQWRIVPPMNLEERRKEFARLYPMYAATSSTPAPPTGDSGSEPTVREVSSSKPSSASTWHMCDSAPCEHQLYASGDDSDGSPL